METHGWYTTESNEFSLPRTISTSSGSSGIPTENIRKASNTRPGAAATNYSMPMTVTYSYLHFPMVISQTFSWSPGRVGFLQSTKIFWTFRNTTLRDGFFNDSTGNPRGNQTRAIESASFSTIIQCGCKWLQHIATLVQCWATSQATQQGTQ
jgi:hypothetical protein